MTYLDLALKVLTEAHRLMWVDDIWAYAKEHGYEKELDQLRPTEEENINQLDSTMYYNIGEEYGIGLLKEQGLYYLTTFENLPLLVEDALDGAVVRTFKEIQEKKLVKKFTPSKRGFDGLVFFWAVPVGLPFGLYIMMTIQGSFYPGPLFILGTLGLVFLFFAPLGLFHIYSTNCDVTIKHDKIEFHKIFPPQFLMASIPIKDLQKIECKGLGLESQVASDFKYIDIRYKKGTQVLNKRFRCHGYINPPKEFDPFDIRIHNFESFASLRSILKEICVLQGIDYAEK